jgi:cell wall-associated NlpC family hydrolase
MRRKHSWPEDLHAFIEARKSEPFAWGKNDCCIFAADAILAMTGIDVAADYRGKSYSDEAGAFAELHQVTGGATVEDAAVYAAGKYGLKSLPSPLFAQRGDLVLFNGDAGLALGIVHLNGRHALVVSTKGLARVPVKNCLKAWRV